MNTLTRLLTIFLVCTLAGAYAHAQQPAIRVLMVGGGTSHDYDRWYKQEDAGTLEKDGLATVTYTSNPADIFTHLPQTDVLFLCNNQPIRDTATRKALFDFVGRGKGLVLAHAAIWYNWQDWPMYNYRLVSGGSRGHEKYGEFSVTVNDRKHPVTKGLPAKFTLNDELYYYKEDVSGPGIKVLATTSPDAAGHTYPSLFVVKHPKARIVGFALGHDAAAHELPAYRTILRNAVKWVAKQ